MGMPKGISFCFDLVVGDPLVAAMHSVRQFGVPLRRRELKMVGDCVVELFSSGVVIVGEIVNPFQVVPERVIDRSGSIGFMDHVGVRRSIAWKNTPFKLLDSLRKLSFRSVELG
jgi:hypothetical protein